jgi:hypothetical protein
MREVSLQPKERIEGIFDGDSNYRVEQLCLVQPSDGSKPGVPIVQHTCTLCGRNFVNEELTGERYALHVGMLVLDRLCDEVTRR